MPAPRGCLCHHRTIAIRDPQEVPFPPFSTAPILVRSRVAPPTFKATNNSGAFCDGAGIRIGRVFGQDNRLCVRRVTATEDYTQAVRYYTTKPANRGVTFACIFCDRSVTTIDFDQANGNRRTQAASAINQHVRESHATDLRIAEAKSGNRGANR